ncbi:hypothetical protein RD110_15660 [Rhodoferax koreense]|uniref:Uncharacterized protein n=1 Tax=Rhodoferax koreensis TaxID=1842727 RepID=A0A1P8JXH5_9BURK|nr:hypothetical protein [Rhodoferax koreense]APW38459.1 hypothetical protein RD110_15660 [Rhodoferax koreense]
MMRRTAIRSKPRQREKAERVYKTPTVAIGRFRLPAPVNDEVRAIPKENALECEAYLRLVASLPCIRCSIVGYSQAAHPPPTGKGIKRDDRLCFPLCTVRVGIKGCHGPFDNYELMSHADAVRQALVWAAQVRAVIVGFRLWPKNLPMWDEVN